MKFGKKFQKQMKETLPEWRRYFLSYKLLKKQLKQLSIPEYFTDVPSHNGVVDHEALQELRQGSAILGDSIDKPPTESAAEAASSKPASEIGTGNGDKVSSQSSTHAHAERNSQRTEIIDEKDFINLIKEELEKFNNFFLDKEEDYVIYWQELKERIERLKEHSRQIGTFTSENELNVERENILRDTVSIHGEMVLLMNYSALNFTGLVKILKKYDKRTGALLRLPFTQIAPREPFSTTELLSKFVHECEENLQSIFPSITLDEVEDCASDPSRDENAQEIYRSTLAALRTIQDLRKGSSTYNPFSFSPFVPGEIKDGLVAGGIAN